MMGPSGLSQALDEEGVVPSGAQGHHSTNIQTELYPYPTANGRRAQINTRDLNPDPVPRACEPTFRREVVQFLVARSLTVPFVDLALPRGSKDVEERSDRLGPRFSLEKGIGQGRAEWRSRNAAVANCRGGAVDSWWVWPDPASGRRVRCQVALQQRSVREDLATGGAGSTLRPVCAHVHVEGALLCEALGANCALEGAHASVRDHVLEQVVAQREGSPAHCALVWLLTRMDEHVLGVVFPRAERLTAVTTLVGRLLCSGNTYRGT